MRDRVINPQDKFSWVEVGNAAEEPFLTAHGACLGLRTNPEKADDRYAPDFVYADGRYADLKTVETPFYKYPGCVTLNAKDMLRYRVCYRTIDLYFWVSWPVPGCGVWTVKLPDLIAVRHQLTLHFYKDRSKRSVETDPHVLAWLAKMEPTRLAVDGAYWRVIDDDGNAACSYVVPLSAPLVRVG